MNPLFPNAFVAHQTRRAFFGTTGLSLGSAAFMAVGAFAAYNFELRVPGLPLPLSLLLGGVVAALVSLGAADLVDESAPAALASLAALAKTPDDRTLIRDAFIEYSRT